MRDGPTISLAEPDGKTYIPLSEEEFTVGHIEAESLKYIALKQTHSQNECDSR